MAGDIERALEAKGRRKGRVRARLKSFEDRIDAALYGPELVKAVGVRTLDRLDPRGPPAGLPPIERFGGKKLSHWPAAGWRGAAPGASKAVEYHKVWVYFARAFGLDLRGTIEERPGIPRTPVPPADHRARCATRTSRSILVDNFYDPALPRRVAGGRRRPEWWSCPTACGGEDGSPITSSSWTTSLRHREGQGGEATGARQRARRPSPGGRRRRGGIGAGAGGPAGRTGA